MPPSDSPATEIFRRVVQRQIASLDHLQQRIEDDAILPIVQALVQCPGRLILMGMGKMGAIARKAAATFSSTGTPAIFVHPSEALHGDLGMITRQDILLALSYSGETDELLQVIETVQPWQVPIMALTQSTSSSLGKLSDHVITIQVAQEATDLVAVPSCSTTAALVVCDALAIAAMESRGFNADDFSQFHPGGALGRRLRTRVQDVMRRDDQIPFIQSEQPLRQAIVEVSAKGVGAALVVDSDRMLLGILTDGDIRRILEKQENPLATTVDSLMSRHPKTCPPDILAAQALRIMEQYRITVLPVTCDSGEIRGIVHLHDLVTARIS